QKSFCTVHRKYFELRRGFRVNMWGTSSPGDKLTGDFGNEPDATSISDRDLFRLLAGNLSPGVFRLLQHNRHFSAVPTAPSDVRFQGGGAKQECRKNLETAEVGPGADSDWLAGCEIAPMPPDAT